MVLQGTTQEAIDLLNAEKQTLGIRISFFAIASTVGHPTDASSTSTSTATVSTTTTSYDNTSYKVFYKNILLGKMHVRRTDESQGTQLTMPSFRHLMKGGANPDAVRNNNYWMVKQLLVAGVTLHA